MQDTRMLSIVCLENGCTLLKVHTYRAASTHKKIIIHYGQKSFWYDKQSDKDWWLNEVQHSTGKMFNISISVSLWRDSGRRNYPIHLKFNTNVYVLYKISCVIFAVHYINSECALILKTVTIHCGLWREMCLYICLPVRHAIVFAEIIRSVWNLVQMFMFYAKLALWCLVYIAWIGTHKSISIHCCLWREIL